MANNYEVKDICVKKVYIVEEHHKVLSAWADYRRKTQSAPILITLDHHTDTQPAFLQWSAAHQYETYENQGVSDLLKAIDFENNDSVDSAIKNLRNDEHIDAAIKTNIIKTAFVINLSESTDNPIPYEILKFDDDNPLYGYMLNMGIEKHKLPKIPQRPYTYPDANIYIIGDTCKDFEPEINFYNKALETDNLADKIDRISEMKPSYIQNGKIMCDYILDIDLDYFHTSESIQPTSKDVFYDLVKGASIITVATEPNWIETWKSTECYDKNISADILLNELLIHIKSAIKY